MALPLRPEVQFAENQSKNVIFSLTNVLARAHGTKQKQKYVVMFNTK
jgi:hypothetical protein